MNVLKTLSGVDVMALLAHMGWPVCSVVFPLRSETYAVADDKFIADSIKKYQRLVLDQEYVEEQDLPETIPAFVEMAKLWLRIEKPACAPLALGWLEYRTVKGAFTGLLVIKTQKRGGYVPGILDHAGKPVALKASEFETIKNIRL